MTNPEALIFSLSPKLTKFYLSYMVPGQAQPIIIIKNIDYDNCYSYDVTFIDLPAFIETIPPNSNSILQARYVMS